ncbi:hypothetical protein B0H19DRAFT_1246985 [Mycena capillaripes]|nr:hypothetical protein B0H19DRAFT_1246985 [Mycena capillaripes]
MYLLSTGYWAFTVAFAADALRVRLNFVPFKPPGSDDIARWLPLVNAVGMINFILSDAVVIWRARTICQRNLKKYLWVTMGFLVLTGVAVFAMIGFRITALNVNPQRKNFNIGIPTIPGLDVSFILQLSSWLLSLISNLSATAVVAITARRYRRIVREAFPNEERKTRSGRVLSVVIEIGVFYSISTLITLLSLFIRLPLGGTLADIYNPISIQIAGAYPPAMILLLGTKRSLNKTTFLNTLGSTPAYPIYGGSSVAYTTRAVTRNRSRTATTISKPDIIHPLDKDASFLFKIPDGLAPELAAPLMCGGAVIEVIETFNIHSTDRVGIVGVGGLGHLAIQFLAKMGASVLVFSSNDSKREEAQRLGATEFYATKAVTAARPPPCHN